MSPTHPSVEARVVGGYRHRAVLARAEVRPVLPALLSKALTGVKEVVEFPCGSGHFLTTYAHQGVRVRLVDGSAPMLTRAVRHARTAGVAELVVGHHFLHELPSLPTADLVVVPNGAFNQLAAQSDLLAVLRRLRQATATGCRLLLQAIGPTAEGTCFYDPHLADGTWVRDHTFTTPDGQIFHRHRHQHHPEKARARIKFAYTLTPDQPCGPHPGTVIELDLPTPAQIRSATEATGWDTLHHSHHQGFIELLAQAGEDR